jgi:hypothetical protein
MSEQEQSFREQVEAATPQEPVPAPETAQEVSTSADEAPSATEAQEPAEHVEKVVPLAALHEERRRRQDLQRDVDEGRRNFAALQQQQAAMLAELQRRMNPPPPPIDEASDPLGAIAQQQRLTAAQVAQLNENFQRQQQVVQEQQFVTNIANNVRQAEADFTTRQPDYQEAVTYLRQAKYNEYVAAGMGEREASQLVVRDAWQLSQYCSQRGESPAERAYAIAKALGYKAQAQAADRVAMQQAGVRASTPAGGGAQGGGRLSLDVLAKMSPDEFLKATAGDKWKKLMQNA